MSVPAMTVQQLPAFLRGLRTDAGLTQEQVAALAGCSRQTVSQLERDPGPVRIGRLLACADALGAPLRLRLVDKATGRELDL